MSRLKLSTIRSRAEASGLRMDLRTVNPGTASRYIAADFIASNGRAILSVDVADLLDPDGNFVEDDLS